jgi:hypothetical protein
MTRKLQEFPEMSHETRFETGQKMFKFAHRLRKKCAANGHFIRKRGESHCYNYFPEAQSHRGIG